MVKKTLEKNCSGYKSSKMTKVCTYRIRSNTMAGSIISMGLFGAGSSKFLEFAGSIRERVLFMLCHNLVQDTLHKIGTF